MQKIILNDITYLKKVLNRLVIKIISDVMNAIADDSRRKNIEVLKRGKISSGDLAVEVGLTPQALSYHLAKLKKADLVYETKYKNFIYYELDLTVLDEVVIWISKLKGVNDEKKMD